MAIAPPEINYSLIGKAVDYYKQAGYKEVAVPWIVPKTVAMMTCPDEAYLQPLGTYATLVGSAEQSFLYMQSMGLPPGKYVATTPCFRPFDGPGDEYHFPYFMKVELYQNFDCTEKALQFMIESAECCLSNLLNSRGHYYLEVQETQEGYDLLYDGIEVGSYGIRQHPVGDTWIYGTGIAEPRFSQVAKDMLA